MHEVNTESNLGVSKLQSHCNEATELTELLRQFYSFAMLYDTPLESEILLISIYRQRKKAQRYRVRRWNLVAFLIIAQFLVLTHGSSFFIPVLFHKAGSISTKEIPSQLRHSQSKLMKQ